MKFFSGVGAFIRHLLLHVGYIWGNKGHPCIPFYWYMDVDYWLVFSDIQSKVKWSYVNSCRLDWHLLISGILYLFPCLQT